MPWGSTLDPAVAAARLEELLTPRITPGSLSGACSRLRRLCAAWRNGCPPPWPAPGLAVTAEIACQSELWLPLAAISPPFETLYRTSLRYTPHLSSTPFASAGSWAGLVTALPPFLAHLSSPDRMMEALLADDDLRRRFLFWSFLPDRFYGGFRRYPAQLEYLHGWLKQRSGSRLRLLDAACGTGEGSYDLAHTARAAGIAADRLQIEGWTLEPLEVWAACHAAFPHDLQRERQFRSTTADILDSAYAACLSFRPADLTDVTAVQRSERFDLIVCNGLLGGPIIHQPARIRRVLDTLVSLLAPGGMLLAANSFHGGWQKRCPVDMLEGLMGERNLQVSVAGEGLAGFLTS